MCFPKTPKVELQSSEDVFDLLLTDAERIEIENPIHKTIFFLNLDLVERFFQLEIQPIDIASAEFEDLGLPLHPDHGTIPYGVTDAPISYISMLNQPVQFNEINPQYFEDEDDPYLTIPYTIYQEL